MTKVMATIVIMSWTTPYSIIVWVVMAAVYLIVQVSSQDVDTMLVYCWVSFTDGRLASITVNTKETFDSYF